ncbi:hypothetical protein BEN47_00735 [Hymenobacter lapidarius]|uniref:Uncharacterized protein n=1 Tax=Hymenobacter lapidarius TaxID=1908237 RepID=A0A1G1TA24_9BACT|nr:hypothetical protein BEN47_00735 [Hymenobacter lapidarius]
MLSSNFCTKAAVIAGKHNLVPYIFFYMPYYPGAPKIGPETLKILLRHYFYAGAKQSILLKYACILLPL